MAMIRSINIAAPTSTEHSEIGVTGIDKRPVGHPVAVTAPERKGVGGSGLAGDTICDLRHHGGTDQAVYAYAREDLDAWAAELGRDLPSGTFGENLTTEGLDVTGARIGDRWRVGDTVVLEVSTPRIPCRTFAGFLRETGWIKRFTDKAVPGTYLRVITPGDIAPGDPITLVSRPDHDVTVGTVFRGLTTEPELLPRLLDATALPDEARENITRRLASRP
jgi:MOSC domain-containing protein YiiM